MLKRPMFIAFFAIILVAVSSALSTPTAATQSARTLAGEWLVRSTPLNGETTSRLGNTLGFPDRDMFFQENGAIRTGLVNREDAGTDVKPLGVWRINGNQFSATFQLWCPNAETPCGSVVMRGEFLSDTQIRGVMTAFFDVADSTRETGYDTWPFNFTGDRIAAGGQSQ
ncbi:MAG: hypothetical protein HY231_15960 [Acidobacteria bacterium]|nr:hypothetical protein [Acidobacteriota bacterium]